MPSLVEVFAAQVGLTIGRFNVIVEGTSDVRLLELACRLHHAECGVDLFADGFAAVPAGYRDDGGVQGVQRRLTAFREMASVDRDASGGLQFRFIGLFDHDYAGRNAAAAACQIDRRIKPYRDIALLRPHMVPASFYDDPAVEIAAGRKNQPFLNLDWEIEDCISEPLKSAFDANHANAVMSRTECAGRTHRDLTRPGKRAFHQFVQAHATHADLIDLVHLVAALRSYMGCPALPIQRIC